MGVGTEMLPGSAWVIEVVFFLPISPSRALIPGDGSVPMQEPGRLSGPDYGDHGEAVPVEEKRDAANVQQSAGGDQMVARMGKRSALVRR